MKKIIFWQFVATIVALAIVFFKNTNGYEQMIQACSMVGFIALAATIIFEMLEYSETCLILSAASGMITMSTVIISMVVAIKLDLYRGLSIVGIVGDIIAAVISVIIIFALLSALLFGKVIPDILEELKIKKTSGVYLSYGMQFILVSASMIAILVLK